MTIREYAASDEPQLIDLWNKCLPFDTINQEILCRRIICDENFDSSLFMVAENANNELTGFIYGAVCKALEVDSLEAWVIAFGVHPKWRLRGIGSNLLVALETAFQGRGTKTIELGGYAPNYFFPGVDKDAYEGAVTFFKSHGYIEKSICCAMDMSLRGYKMPEKAAKKRSALEDAGYKFLAFRLQDSLAVLSFMREAFPEWVNNMRDSILHGRAEKTVILAWSPKGEVVGFVMRGMDGTEERFGPFGVLPSMQGKGIGGILFHALMSSMVAGRIFYTYFLWGEGENIDMYGSWGMKRFREYMMMGKTLHVG